MDEILLQLTYDVADWLHEKIAIYNDGRVTKEILKNNVTTNDCTTINCVDELKNQLIEAYDKMIEIYDNELYSSYLFDSDYHKPYKVTYNNHDFYSRDLYWEIESIIMHNEITKLSILNEYESKKKLLEMRLENKKHIAEYIKILDKGNKEKKEIDFSDFEDNHIFNDEKNIISFKLEKTSKFEIGQSKFFSDVIDISSDVEIPEALEFVGQLNLSEISQYDKNGMLPKNGMLYFFQSPLVFAGKTYEFGKVIYSKNMDLKRKKVKPTELNFEMMMNLSIKDISNSTEKFSDRFEEYDGNIEYNSCKGEELNKIYGFYTDCQMYEDDIKIISERYIVLLQLGTEIFGEGTTTFLITEEDLKNENFDNIIFVYSQT